MLTCRASVSRIFQKDLITPDGAYQFLLSYLKYEIMVVKLRNYKLHFGTYLMTNKNRMASTNLLTSSCIIVLKDEIAYSVSCSQISSKT